MPNSVNFLPNKTTATMKVVGKIRRRWAKNWHQAIDGGNGHCKDDAVDRPIWKKTSNQLMGGRQNVMIRFHMS